MQILPFFQKNTHFFIIFRKNNPVFRDMIRFFTLFSQKQPCFFGNMPEKSFYRIFRKQHPYRHKTVLFFLFGTELSPSDGTDLAAARRSVGGALRQAKCYFVNNFLFQSTIIL